MGRKIEGLIEEGMTRVKANVVDPVVNYFNKMIINPKPEDQKPPANTLSQKLRKTDGRP